MTWTPTKAIDVPHSVTPDASQEYRASRSTLERLTSTLGDAALEVAWTQWAAMGSTASSRRRARSIVDPEALLLLSLALAPRERRLDDVVHDWVAIASDLLSVQRIGNLAEAYPAHVDVSLGELAGTALRRGKDSRWKALAVPPGDKPDGSKERRTNKVRAVRPPLIEPPILLLRLRLAFGVGIKADTLGFLLGTDGAWASVRVIAAATGYTASAVRRAVDDMAAARVVHSLEDTATQYRADPAAWAAMLEIPEPLPPWRRWQERFAFVAAFVDWSERMRDTRLSRYALASSGRDLLEAHASAFARDRVVPWRSEAPADEWPEILDRAVTSLAEWMREQV